MQEAVACAGDKGELPSIQVSAAAHVNDSPDLYKHTFPEEASEAR